MSLWDFLYMNATITSSYPLPSFYLLFLYMRFFPSLPIAISGASERVQRISHRICPQSMVALAESGGGSGEYTGYTLPAPAPPAPSLPFLRFADAACWLGLLVSARARVTLSIRVTIYKRLTTLKRRQKDCCRHHQRVSLLPFSVPDFLQE